MGKVENNEMVLNDAGQMVANEWLKIPGRFPNVKLHRYVIMPNHFHAIMEITVGATLVVAPSMPGSQSTDNQPIDNQPTDTQPTDNQPTGSQPIDNQPTDSQPTDNQPTDTQRPLDQFTLNQITDNQRPLDQFTLNQPTDTQRPLDQFTLNPPTDNPPIDNKSIDNQPIPNGQIGLGNRKGATTRVAPTVGNIVGAFQSIVTVNYIHGVKNHKWQPFNGKLWQRNYWEHIIRDENSYYRISDYILNNPGNWHKDNFNSY